MKFPFNYLTSAQYHSNEDVVAEFAVPPQESFGFVSRLKLALGLSIDTTRGRSDAGGNVKIGAHLTGLAAEKFVAQCPANMLDH